MGINKEKYQEINAALNGNATLVAVSKTKPVEDIRELYDLGHRDFGENYVQELVEKYEALPKDIRWHFIGHLQSNKIKFISPFINLVHGVDSWNLLTAIDKQAAKHQRVINVLLQVHIATEETKFGLSETELQDIFDRLKENELKNVKVKGLMGMASFTTNMDLVRAEFAGLKRLFDAKRHSTFNHPPLTILSMGMSADHTIALEEGSNMVRIGSLLFGERNKEQ